MECELGFIVERYDDASDRSSNLNFGLRLFRCQPHAVSRGILFLLDYLTQITFQTKHKSFIKLQLIGTTLTYVIILLQSSSS